MAKIVTDPDNLPINIFQINISRVPLLTTEFLDEVTKKVSEKCGIKRNNYYLLPTENYVSWLQPTEQLKRYNFLLRTLRVKKGYKYLMVINDTNNV